MTRTRKKTLAVLMALSVVIPGGVAPTSEAAAKKVKLSKTKVSIQVGKTKKISIKNAKKGAKVTWKTSNKKVVKIVKSKKKEMCIRDRQPYTDVNPVPEQEVVLKMF